MLAAVRWLWVAAALAVAAILGVYLALASGAASTARRPSVPHIVSDPYPLGHRQPSRFLVSCDHGTAVDSTPAVKPDGTHYLSFSLAGLAPGAHTCEVSAADASDHRTSAVSISFTL